MLSASPGAVCSSSSSRHSEEVVTSVLPVVLLMNASSGWAEDHLPADVEALPSSLSSAAAVHSHVPRPTQSTHLSSSSPRPISPIVDNGENDLEQSYPNAEVHEERSVSTGSSRSNRSSASSSSSGSSSDPLSEFSCNSLSEGASSTKELCPRKTCAPMGSSSCCRQPSAYEKVLSLGCPPCIPCGRSSSDASLTVLLEVAQRPRRCTGPSGRQTSGNSDTSGSGHSSSSERPSPTFGTSVLYNPLKLEQRQRHIEGAFRDFQVQSKSARHDLELNLPTHVRLRPGEGPPTSLGPWSERRRPPVHLDNCVRPPPNRSPFTPPASICRKASTTSKTVPTAQSTHTTAGNNGTTSNNNNNNTTAIITPSNNSQLSSGDRGSGAQVTGGRCGRKTL